MKASKIKNKCNFQAIFEENDGDIFCCNCSRRDARCREGGKRSDCRRAKGQVNAQAEERRKDKKGIIENNS
jgi:hypothetical protein